MNELEQSLKKVEDLIESLRGNEWENYFHGKLFPVKFEIQRQLSHLYKTQ
jgi:hypothetical protein